MLLRNDQAIRMRSDAAVFVLFMALCWSGPAPLDAEVVFHQQARAPESVPQHGIVELSFEHDGIYENKFLDIVLDATLTSPDGSQQPVKGFHYAGDVWKIRFRPDTPGRWTYTYVFAAKGGFRHQGGASFDCKPSDAKGPVRRHPSNPYRWVFANGEPFFPVGLQDCFPVWTGRPPTRVIDGEERSAKGRRVSLEDYFATYGQAGFNLFRFSQNNCSYPLFDDLDHVREDGALATDRILSLAREHGFRIMFGFFGFYSNRSRSNSFAGLLTRLIDWALQRQHETISALDTVKLTKEKRFIDYCIARWGVYVDFWELVNEGHASDEWTTLMAEHVRAADPSGKPISTSWERPHLPAIDINAPHWYESESELESDLRVHQQAERWKQAGKPVIVGEQGNTGMNWDPGSATRMRVRTWTALFQEMTFVFWNTSWSKAGMHHGHYSPGRAANIYLGPEERGYVRVLQDFSSRLDADVRMAPVEVSSPTRVRAYGLISGSVAAAYLLDTEDHKSWVRDAKITFDAPGTAAWTTDLVAEWIDPSTGNVVYDQGVSPSLRTLDVPPFLVDLALLIAPREPKNREDTRGPMKTL